ncbi:hypothetical protein TNIN_360541 [Trichonephila inaurata madagascariensis]|uniref:Uncharacterized protein n=1 Tax=Trichonephila inaurata madagascariensis TaxID=2747483 RepID=A0A8X6XRI8_9ARAC|nr:hypothetical protein TNIN_360541 [Trichonephila inaurata madagascariensis]
MCKCRGHPDCPPGAMEAFRRSSTNNRTERTSFEKAVTGSCDRVAKGGSAVEGSVELTCCSTTPELSDLGLLVPTFDRKR